MLRLRNLQIDVVGHEADRAVAWWATALGGTPRETDGTYVHLDGVRGRVGVHLQRVGVGPGGYHLDLEADDVAAETQRLVDAGAVDAGPVVDGEPGERMLRDPAGLLFCIAVPGQAQHLVDDPERLHLRVLMLDLPGAAAAAATATFWAEALGGAAVPVGEGFPAYTWVDGAEGPGGPTAVAVQAIEEGAAGMHVDLHCADLRARDLEVARLVDAGATEVSRGEGRWVVLRAPGGHLVCVVPDAA